VRPHRPLAPRPLRRCDHISFLSKNRVPGARGHRVPQRIRGHLCRPTTSPCLSRRGHHDGDPRAGGSRLSLPARRSCPLDHFKVVAAHDLVDFVRAQAGDRRTGRSPSAGRSFRRTGLLPRQSGALSHILLGAEPLARQTKFPPLRDHCVTSKSPVRRPLLDPVETDKLSRLRASCERGCDGV
jgi:hypothetical protein